MTATLLDTTIERLTEADRSLLPLTRMTMAGKLADAETVRRLFELVDLDGSGSLDLNEFYELQRQKRGIGRSLSQGDVDEPGGGGLGDSVVR